MRSFQIFALISKRLKKSGRGRKPMAETRCTTGFIDQLRAGLRNHSAYHVVDDLIILLRATNDQDDAADADVLADILSQLH